MKLNMVSGKLVRATAHSAGYDIFAAEVAEVRPGERMLIPTGVYATFEPGHVALFRDKSGLAAKHGIFVLGGVIDPDYVKEWKVILANFGMETVIFRPGDPLCNVLFLATAPVECDAQHFLELNVERTGGFGSTSQQPQI